jgi:hypothetical protein
MQFNKNCEYRHKTKKKMTMGPMQSNYESDNEEWEHSPYCVNCGGSLNPEKRKDK